MTNLVALERRMGPRILQGQMRLADTVPRLSTEPLTDTTEILRRMPTQAISTELFGLLDILSTPILLFEDSSGEQRKAQQSSLRKAA